MEAEQPSEKVTVSSITSSNAPKTGWLQYAFPALISLQLLVSCIVTSAKKPFWFDEMLTYYLASDTSFRHMFVGVQSHFNTLPPLYNLALWGWARVFGASELSLRLPSCLCFIGAFWVLWLTLRPRFGTAPTFVGIAAVLTSHLAGHNAEARPYSLYLFFCALTIYQFAAWNAQPERARSFYIVNMLFHAGMLFTHLFGFLYSASLLLAVVLVDRRQWRVSTPSEQKTRAGSVPMIVSILAAWALFALLWLKPTLHQMGAFKPYSWVALPHLRDLIDALLMDTSRTSLLLAIGISACFVLSRLAKRTPQAPISTARLSPDTTQAGGTKPLILLAGLFLILPPVAAYIISHVSASVFVDRYFIPSLLAWVILLTFLAAELQSRLEAWRTWSGKLQPRHILAALALLLLTIVTVGMLRRDETLRYGPDVASFPETGSLPIVCESYTYFPPHVHYSPKSSAYVFLLDENAALQSAPDEVGWEMVQSKLMLALHEQYPALAIRDWRAFLRDHDQFVVIADTHSRWADVRLKSNPAYVCTETVREDMHLIWVQRKH